MSQATHGRGVKDTCFGFKDQMALVVLGAALLEQC